MMRLLFVAHIMLAVALGANQSLAGASGGYRAPNDYPINDSYDDYTPRPNNPYGRGDQMRSQQQNTDIPEGQYGAESDEPREWRGAMRDLSREGPGRFYFGFRAGMLLSKDHKGRANVSGYTAPAGSANHDFTAALADAGRWEAEIGDEAAISVQLGYTLFAPALNGRFRFEADATYAFHETKLCTFPVPNARQVTAANVQLGGAGAYEAAGTDAAFRALVQGNKRCRTYEEPLYHFGGNVFYDLTYAPKADGAITDGARTGVHFTLGAGAGYVINDNEIPRTTITADNREPRLVKADNVLQFGSSADTNATATIAQSPDATKDGLIVPAFAGVGYSLEYLTGQAVIFEILYRHNIVAPEGFEGSAVLAGLRYRF